MIGIIVPLSQELKSITKKPVPLGEAFHLDQRLVLICSGMGQQAAQTAAQDLLNLGAEVLVSWGSATALAPDLKPGTLLLPERVRGKEGIYPCDPSLQRSLASSLVPVAPFGLNQEMLYGAADLLYSVEQKKTLYQRAGTIAADMESAYIAAVALRAGMPFLAIRAVADSAKMALPQSIQAASSPDGSFDLLKFLKQALVQPQDWGSIVELGMSFSKAEKSLKAAFEALYTIYS